MYGQVRQELTFFFYLRDVAMDMASFPVLSS